MSSWGDPGFGQLAAAALLAVLVGYGISWTIDRLLLRRFTEDRVGGIAMSCALAFLILMGATTFLLTWSSPFVDGPIIIPPLGYAVAFLLGVAGAGALRMAVYSRAYEHNDDQELFEPDWSDLSRYDEEIIAFDEKYAGKNYLRRHWAGHLPLPVSYWINGALLSVAIAALAEFLAGKAETKWGSLRIVAIVSLSYFVVSTLVWIWSSVGIWRSAYWHPRRGGSAGWGMAARALILLGAAATLFRSGDLALQATEFGQLAAGRDSIGAIAEMKVSPDGRDLVLRGNIAAGAADRFETMLAANPSVKAVVLTSPGGRMLESGRIAAAIRKRGLDTRVDDYCMSACTDVLLAGRARTAPNRARIGFHQPDFPGISSSERGNAIDLWRTRYLDAGVEQYFVERAMATPASDMWFPTPDELFAANVLTGSDIVVAGAGHRRGGVAQPESLSDQRLRADLRAEAARTNASAPVRVDAFTTLDRVAADGFTLTNYYTVRAGNIDVGASRRGIGADLRRKLCSDPSAAAAVRDGARFAFVYRDSSGRRLFDVAVDQC
jgi:hypothetical protein